MSRIERWGRRIGRGLCLLALAGGLTLTAVAIRDGFTMSARIDRDLGAWGWVLYAVVLAGGVIQLCATGLLLRGRAGTWADVRCGLILFVGTAIFYLVLFPRSDGLSVEMFVAAWAGAFGAAVLLAALRPRERTSRIGFWLFQICLVLVMVEGGLRLASHVAPNPALIPEVGSVLQKIEAHSIAPGYVHFGFPHNSDGFYDDEFVPADERTAPTVAVIGDSFSLSLVPHRAHYTTVCERELGDTLLYNIGVGACGPEEYRQLLVTDALPLGPDAVVVSVFVGNDLYDMRLHSPGKRVRSWFDRGSCRLYLVVSRLLKVARERSRVGASWSANTNSVLQTEEELIEAYPWYADPRLDPGKFSPEAYMEIVRKRIPTACSPDRARLGALVETVGSMRDLAGRPFGVVLLPAEFQVEESVWNEALEGLDSRGHDRDEPQRSLRAGFEELGIPCLDLLPLLRAAKPLDDGNRHLYRLRDTHFSVGGNEIAGRALAPFVRELMK